MPVPLLTSGYQIAPITAEAAGLETSLGRSLSTTADEALYYAPTSSLYRSSRLQAIAKQTGGLTGVGGVIEPAGRRLSQERREQRIQAQYEIREEAIDKGLWISKEDGEARLKTWGFTAADVGLTDFGMNAIVFNYVLEANKEERKRQTVLANAAPGVIGSTLRFGTSLAASMVDPINLGSAFVPIFGQARYASVANSVGNRSLRAMQRGREIMARRVIAAGFPESGLAADDIAQIGMRAFDTSRRALNRGIIPLQEQATFGARTVQRLGVGVTEGAVGAALVEPFIVEAASLEQLDYGMVDAYMNVLFGSIIGGGLHMGLGAIGDAVARGRSPDTTQPQGIMNEAISNIDPTTHNYASRSAVGQTESGYNVNVDLVLAQDPRTAQPIVPARDPMPVNTRVIATPDGRVSIARVDTPEHVIGRALPEPDAEAAKSFAKLPEFAQRQAKLQAMVDLIKADKPGLGGVKTSAGNDTILSAMVAEGGVKGRTQFSKGAQRTKEFKKGYSGAPSKGAGSRVMKGEGGITPSEMAKRLKDNYGIGDGTTGKMWSLLGRDVKERASMTNAMDQAMTELALIRPVAEGIVSPTLNRMSGLDQQNTVAARLEATRQALTDEGNAGAVRMAQQTNAAENIRGYNAAASRAGNETIDRLPAVETADEIDADIASINDELIASGVDPDVLARGLDEVDALVNEVNQRGDAFSQAMVCGLGRGA